MTNSLPGDPAKESAATQEDAAIARPETASAPAPAADPRVTLSAEQIRHIELQYADDEQFEIAIKPLCNQALAAIDLERRVDDLKSGLAEANKRWTGARSDLEHEIDSHISSRRTLRERAEKAEAELAAKSGSASPEQAAPVVSVDKRVLLWLLGENAHPETGEWFERPADGNPFWWRKQLRKAMLAAAPAASVTEAQISDIVRAQMQGCHWPIKESAIVAIHEVLALAGVRVQP